MSTLAKSNDPEKMAYDGSFHEGLHYLRRRYTIFIRINSLYPLDIYIAPCQINCIKPEGKPH